MLARRAATARVGGGVGGRAQAVAGGSGGDVKGEEMVLEGAIIDTKGPGTKVVVKAISDHVLRLDLAWPRKDFSGNADGKGGTP